MKKVLITGANSYIGTSFEKYMKQFEGYQIDTMDMIDGTWRQNDFSGYDTVFHVAGIAHSETGKISEERKQIYYKVNTDLTIETAKKAKSDGVKQFIFMSSAIVYGDSASIGKSKRITDNMPISPANCYGDSKVQAENGIRILSDDSFKVVILRPPMIYGKGSKGNYPELSKLAQKLPLFPNIKNERSVLYIENLASFVKLMIDNNENGTFFPQNSEYMSTSQIVKLIAEAHGKKILLVRGTAWALKIMSHFSKLVNKAFGNFSYDMGLSEYKQEYRVYSLKDSIGITENKSNANANPRALILASVASMIDQFNMNNIQLLLDHGYDVDVACNCKTGNNISDDRIKYLIDKLEKKGVKVFDVPIPRRISNFRGIIKSISLVKQIEKNNHYSLMHCHSPIGSVVARIAFNKARKNGTKVVYTAHGFHFYKGAPKLNWILFYPIEKYFAHFTTDLITINREDYLFASKHLKSRRVHYVPGIGIDTAYFKKQLIDKSKKRKEFNISGNAIIVFSVGELNYNKNHVTVIKALSEVNIDNLYYIVTGKGERKEELEKLALQLGVKLILTGYRTDVADLYHMSDIYVFPSYREGLSVSLMEAMASGLPCVVSNIRGNNDLIDEDKGGVLCAPDNIEQFANGIEKLVSDSFLRQRFSEYNIIKIQSFDKNNIGKLISDIYFHG